MSCLTSIPLDFDLPGWSCRRRELTGRQHQVKAACPTPYSRFENLKLNLFCGTSPSIEELDAWKNQLLNASADSHSGGR